MECDDSKKEVVEEMGMGGKQGGVLVKRDWGMAPSGAIWTSILLAFRLDTQLPARPSFRIERAACGCGEHVLPFPPNFLLLSPCPCRHPADMGWCQLLPAVISRYLLKASA